MAAEASKIQPEAAPQERAPEPTAQEAPPQPAKQEPGLRGLEQRQFEEGEKILKEKWKELDLQAEPEAQKFKEETKSLWSRAKERLFGKKEGTEAAPVKGEEEILKEIEKADAVYAEFKKKYGEVMASGDETALRGMESSLSQAYEQLAPQVAAEGAAESKQWKKALKTGEQPPMTEAGAKLNEVTRRLAEVRGRLNGAPAPAEAAPSAAEAPAAGPAQAEKDLDEAIARGVAEFEAEQAVAAAAPKGEREELAEKIKGSPGEKMLDDYLAIRGLTSDRFGEIVGTAFDPRKGEIRVNYQDGSSLRKYASGRTLRVFPGGKVEEVAPEAPKKPEAQIVEEPAAEEEIFTEEEKAQLREAGAQTLAESQMGGRGEIEEKPYAVTSEQSPVAAGEIENKTVLQKIKTSEESPTASGEIGGEPAAPLPPSPKEVYPGLPEPVPGSVPPGVPETAPAETPPAEEEAPEKLDMAFLVDRVDAAVPKVAKALAAGAEAPKTLASKIGRMPAGDLLAVFKQAGEISDADQEELREMFRTEPEALEALRKKLAQAIRKQMRG